MHVRKRDKCIAHSAARRKFLWQQQQQQRRLARHPAAWRLRCDWRQRQQTWLVSQLGRVQISSRLCLPYCNPTQPNTNWLSQQQQHRLIDGINYKVQWPRNGNLYYFLSYINQLGAVLQNKSQQKQRWLSNVLHISIVFLLVFFEYFFEYLTTLFCNIAHNQSISCSVAKQNAAQSALTE